MRKQCVGVDFMCFQGISEQITQVGLDITYSHGSELYISVEGASFRP